MTDPCDACTSHHFAIVEREIAEQEAEQERREQEHDAAVDQWIDDVMTYAAEVVPQHAQDWALYALALKNGDTSMQEPVLPPAPIHPDLIPPEPVGLDEEVPL